MKRTWSPVRWTRVVAAFEPCDAALDQRRVGRAKAERDAFEAVGVRTREAARELDLVVREHVDDVALRVFERGEALRAPAEAPHDKRRGERDRVERVRGKADVAAVGAPRGDDRDAGRELCERVAKLAFGERPGRGCCAAVGWRGRQEAPRAGRRTRADGSSGAGPCKKDPPATPFRRACRCIRILRRRPRHAGAAPRDRPAPWLRALGVTPCGGRTLS